MQRSYTGFRETPFDRIVIFLGLSLRIALVSISIFVAAPMIIYLGITTFRCWYVSSPLFEGRYALIAIWLLVLPGSAILALSVKGAISMQTRSIRWGEFGLVVLPVTVIVIFWILF
jgi:hypothetical protein